MVEVIVFMLDHAGLLLSANVHSSHRLHHSLSRLHICKPMLRYVQSIILNTHIVNLLSHPVLSICSAILFYHHAIHLIVSFIHLIVSFILIAEHRLRVDYDFDKYMVRCMEDEFQKIVGIRYSLFKTRPFQIIALRS